MAMKRIVLSVCAAVAAVVLAATPLVGRGASITIDQVRQRYPWNGIVDIDYTVTLDGGETPDFGSDRIEVLVVNREVTPNATNLAVSLSEPPPITAGRHRVSWRANDDGVDYSSSDVSVIFKWKHYAARYMVVDVSEGPDAPYWPVKYYDGEPVDGFNTDEYKTGKIALRLINPGSYVAGTPLDEPGRTALREVQHPVTLTKPFYVGLFEVTQGQYLNVMGGNNPVASGFAGSADVDNVKPVYNVSYNTIRGTVNTSTHQYDWPWTNAVAASSFMGKLRAKCKAKDGDGNYTVSIEGFDLPTEFQWEYACRAGTIGSFGTNAVAKTSAEQTSQFAAMGYSGSKKTNKVGSRQPNPWGLYDMHGNVLEWCLDWYEQDVQKLNQPVDPVGPNIGLAVSRVTGAACKVLRGGGMGCSAAGCRSGIRDHVWPPSSSSESWGYTMFGFRLAVHSN